MSQENVEIVLESLPLFEAEDFGALTRLWHPDGRITAPKDWPEPVRCGTSRRRPPRPRAGRCRRSWSG